MGAYLNTGILACIQLRSPLFCPITSKVKFTTIITGLNYCARARECLRPSRERSPRQQSQKQLTTKVATQAMTHAGETLKYSENLSDSTESESKDRETPDEPGMQPERPRQRKKCLPPVQKKDIDSDVIRTRAPYGSRFRVYRLNQLGHAVTKRN